MAYFRMARIFFVALFLVGPMVPAVDLKGAMDEEMGRSHQTALKLESLAYDFLKHQLNGADLPEAVDGYLKNVMAPVLRGKALNIKLSVKPNEPGVLFLESAVSGHGLSHRLGSYRIVFNDHEQIQFVIPKITTTHTGRYQDRKQKELELFNYEVSGDLETGPVKTPDSVSKQQGELRSLFRADPLLHPHITNIFKTGGSEKKHLSELQESVLRELLTIEKKQDPSSVKPLASGVFMPVGSGKTVVAALYFKRLHELYLKNNIQSPNALKKKMKILFIVENLRILEDAKETFSEIYGVPDQQIIKLFGGGKLDNYSASLLKASPLWFSSRSSFYNSKEKIYELIAQDPDSSWVFIFDEAHHVGTQSGQIEEILTELKQKENALLKAKDRVFYMSATLMHDDKNIIADLDGNLVAPFLTDSEKGVLLKGENVEQMVQKQLFRGMASCYIAPLFKYDSLIYQNFSDLPLVLRDIEYDQAHQIKYLAYHKNFIRIIFDKIQQVALPPLGDRGIIFVPTIGHADLYKREFEKVARRNSDFFEVYHSQLTDIEKKRVLHWYRNPYGKNTNRYLIVIDGVNEGVDFPESNLIVNLRINNSFKTLTQNLGRILRVTGFKADARLIDVSHSFHQIVKDAIQSGYRYMKDWRDMDRQEINRYDTIVRQKLPLPPEDFQSETVEFMDQLTRLDQKDVATQSEEAFSPTELSTPDLEELWDQVLNEGPNSYLTSTDNEDHRLFRETLFQRTFDYLASDENRASKESNEKAWMVLFSVFPKELHDAIVSRPSNGNFTPTGRKTSVNFVSRFSQVNLTNLIPVVLQIETPFNYDANVTLVHLLKECALLKTKGSLSPHENCSYDGLLTYLHLEGHALIKDTVSSHRVMDLTDKLWEYASLSTQKAIIDSVFGEGRTASSDPNLVDFLFREAIQCLHESCDRKVLYAFADPKNDLDLFFGHFPRGHSTIHYFEHRYFKYKDRRRREDRPTLGDFGYDPDKVQKATPEEYQIFWSRFRTEVASDKLNFLAAKSFLYFAKESLNFLEEKLSQDHIEDAVMNKKGDPNDNNNIYDQVFLEKLLIQANEYHSQVRASWGDAEWLNQSSLERLWRMYQTLIRRVKKALILKNGQPAFKKQLPLLASENIDSPIKTTKSTTQKEPDSPSKQVPPSFESQLDEAIQTYFQRGFDDETLKMYQPLAEKLKAEIQSLSSSYPIASTNASLNGFESAWPAIIVSGHVGLNGKVPLNGLEAKVITLLPLLGVHLSDLQLNDRQLISFLKFVIEAEKTMVSQEVGYRSLATALQIQENYQKYWDVIRDGPTDKSSYRIRDKKTWNYLHHERQVDPYGFRAPITVDSLIFQLLNRSKGRSTSTEKEKWLYNDLLSKWIELRERNLPTTAKTLNLFLSYFLPHLSGPPLAHIVKETITTDSHFFENLFDPDNSYSMDESGMVPSKNHQKEKSDFTENVLNLLFDFGLKYKDADRKDIFWFVTPDREVEFLFGDYRQPSNFILYIINKYYLAGYTSTMIPKVDSVALRIGANVIKEFKRFDLFNQVKISEDQFWQSYEKGPFRGGNKNVKKTMRAFFLINYVRYLQKKRAQGLTHNLTYSKVMNTLLRELKSIQAINNVPFGENLAGLMKDTMKSAVEEVLPLLTTDGPLALETRAQDLEKLRNHYESDMYSLSSTTSEIDWARPMKDQSPLKPPMSSMSSKENTDHSHDADLEACRQNLKDQ